MKNYPSIGFSGTTKQFSNVITGSEFNIFGAGVWEDHAIVTKTSETNIWYKQYNGEEHRLNKKMFDMMEFAEITNFQIVADLKDKLQDYFAYFTRCAEGDVDASHKIILKFQENQFGQMDPGKILK